MTIIEVITQAPNVEVIAPLPLSVEAAILNEFRIFSIS